MTMKELLKELCLIDGVSGDETAVREAVIEKIKDVCDDYHTDNLGSLICFKKGRKTPAKKLMICAHGRGWLYRYCDKRRRYARF